MITRNSLSAGGQSFPLRDIQEIRLVTTEKNKALPISIAMIGAAAAVAGVVGRSGAALALGIMLIVVGGLAWRTQDVMFRLFVKTPNGEREAVSSTDAEFLTRVERALRAMLAAR
ncbi:DUF6232 family protein [Trinickia sp.]|uniref:DUF6232 family protein n=1 Tax=Trinickia sp. TaxID=2571163 RepID=UPI0039C9B6AB